MSAWQYGSKQAGIDFYQMWAASQVQGRSDIENLYDRDTEARLGQEFIRWASEGDTPDFLAVAKYWKVLESYSSPFLYSIFKLLPGRDYLAAFDLYRTICLVSLVVSITLLSWLVRLTVAQSAGLVGVCSGFFGPVISDIGVGNVNQLQLLALSLALYLEADGARWRRMVGTAIIAAVTVFKPNVGLAVPVLVLPPLFQRRWGRLSEEVAALAGGSVFVLVIGSISARSPLAWLQWVEKIRRFPEGVMARPGNFSSQRVLASALPSFTPAVASTLIVILVAGAFLWGRRSEDDRAGRLLLLNGGILGSLLASPLVWFHYLVLSIPAAMLLMSRLFATRIRIAALTGFLLLSSVLFQGSGIDRAIPVRSGVVVLFGLTVWCLARPSPQLETQ